MIKQGAKAMPIIIDGKKTAQKIKCRLKDKISNLKIKPGLAVILVGDNPASQVYVSMKKKACDEIGIKSFEYKLSQSASEDELIKLIKKLNKDKKVHGILVQLPLPGHINENNILFTIDPGKDVDGFHPMNIGKMMIGAETFLPCTPYGIQKLLEEYNIKTTGKNVVILGRSNIVGKPIGMMLLQKHNFGNATVIFCHSQSEKRDELLKQADIIIAAIGKPNFVKADMIKDGAVIIDVGINRVSGKIVGDVDYDDVFNKVSAITPVPGGVGPMTIAMLMSNTLQAYGATD